MRNNKQVKMSRRKKNAELSRNGRTPAQIKRKIKRDFLLKRYNTRNLEEVKRLCYINTQGKEREVVK